MILAIQRRVTAGREHFRRAEAFKDLGRWNEALASYTLAASAAPEYMEAHCNRGNVLRQLERWPEALDCYDEALAISPDAAMLHSNRGVVLLELGRLEESLMSFDRAVALQPDYATARYNRALLRLARGDLQQGFADYEWRWQDLSGSIHKEKRTFTQPRWSGSESLRGRSVLVYGEQGYGDTLQFSRYVPRLAELGARVILQVSMPLVSLLADLPGVSQLVPLGSPLPDFDFQIPLMSAALAFKTTLQTIPLAERYLTAEPQKVSEWQARLGPKRSPRVGLAWSGNAAHARDTRRSIGLQDLLAGLPEGMQYVSLQKEVRDRDLVALRSCPELRNFADDLHDFSDTAALCESLDFIVSVDTSVAHLGGALGKPTLVLLPSICDWRWLLDRGDTPWYRSVRLYRRKPAESWQAVVQCIGADLERMVADQDLVSSA